ncbi:MAG: hypothetical protein DRO40_06655 [Thermoprotei archaeon]|nr:MAG: hypothetical protein DRO40_06655 [Thermoprotei archaeon]
MINPRLYKHVREELRYLLGLINTAMEEARGSPLYSSFNSLKRRVYNTLQQLEGYDPFDNIDYIEYLSKLSIYQRQFKSLTWFLRGVENEG